MSKNNTTDEKFKGLSKIQSLILALKYLERHPTRCIFPVAKGAKFPPCHKDNLDKGCSNDPEIIRAWANKYPGCNWALAHRKSGMMPIDVDTNPAKGKQGQATFDGLDLAYGWPDTEKTTTPSGGFHMIYEGWADENHPAHIMALGKAGLGMDIDSPNYTLIPGCTFADGTSYVSNGAAAVACPSWIYDVIRDTKAAARITNAAEIVVDLDKPENVDSATNYLQEDAEPAIEGRGGDSATYRAACYLKDLGISIDLGAQLLNDVYNPRCEPAWSLEDLTKKMQSAYNYGSLSKVGGKTAEADFADDAPDADFEPKGKPEATAAQVAERAELAKMDAARTPDERDRKWNRPQVCEEIVYVTTLKRFIKRDDPAIVWDVQGFNNKFGYLDKKNGKLAQTLFAATKATIRKPDSMVYRPTLGEFVNGSWNQWRPSRIVAAPGDTALWDAHLAYLFPNEVERGHLLDWLAGVLQQQQVKPMHALLLVGKTQGTGKSFIIRVLAALIGESNWQALTQDILANGFTGWATRTKLVTVEELRAVSKTEIAKKLHPWITQREMTVNEKNLPTFVIDQCIAFAFMSNKPDAIELDNSDRRYLILETMADVHPDGPSYYQKLYGKNDAGGLLQDDAALGAILDQLMNRDLGKYDIAGPAPGTAAKVAMKDASANDIGQWIKQHIGQPPFSFRVVTVGEIIAALPKFMQNRITMKTIREALEYLGGISWPTQIEPDGSKGDRFRVWLLGEAADRCRERKWLRDVGDRNKKFPILQMYREDHGPGVAVVNVRMIGEDDAPALLDFGEAADDFEDAYSPVLEPVIDPWD